MQLHIRKAVLADVKDIHKIELAQFKERAFSRAKFRHYISKAKGYVLVVASSDAVYGYCVVFYRARYRSARVHVIAMDPKLTGQGWGTRMLQIVEGSFLGNNISLEVDAKNLEAIKLYHRLGYMSAAVLFDFYGDGKDAIKMIKDLI